MAPFFCNFDFSLRETTYYYQRAFLRVRSTLRSRRVRLNRHNLVLSAKLIVRIDHHKEFLNGSVEFSFCEEKNPIYTHRCSKKTSKLSQLQKKKFDFLIITSLAIYLPNRGKSS